MYIVSACLLGKKCRYNGEDCFTYVAVLVDNGKAAIL